MWYKYLPKKAASDDLLTKSTGPFILTGQHDDPILTISVDVKLNAAELKVGLGNFLTGVFMAVVVLIHHHRPALMQLKFDERIPVGSANFIKVVGGNIQEPISTSSSIS